MRARSALTCGAAACAHQSGDHLGDDSYTITMLARFGHARRMPNDPALPADACDVHAAWPDFRGRAIRTSRSRRGGRWLSSNSPQPNMTSVDFLHG